MKTVERLVLLPVFVLLVFTSCDKIDEPVIIIDEQNITDGLLDDNFIMDSVTVTRKQVLLEDFTGHKCVNCPEAALAAQALAEELNHKLVIYSIHAGYYAEPDQTGDFTADYRCPEGNQLDAEFNVQANPTGLINRVVYNGSILVGAGNWEAAVKDELEKVNSVDLKVRNIYYPDLNKTQISVFTRFHAPSTDKYMLVVYLVEGKIVSPQKNNNEGIGPTPVWLLYEHHNILRTSINTTFGGPVTTDETVEVNKEYSNHFIVDLSQYPEDWIIGNCNLIAYVYNDETKEILQVAELAIKTEK